MKKKAFKVPVMHKVRAQETVIVCKKAACSGSSTHTTTTSEVTNVVIAEKVA